MQTHIRLYGLDTESHHEPVVDSFSKSVHPPVRLEANTTCEVLAEVTSEVKGTKMSIAPLEGSLQLRILDRWRWMPLIRGGSGAAERR
jgi:hypothetical protein